MATIGQRNHALINLIKVKFLTQTAFAKAVGSTNYNVSRVVNSRQELTIGDYRMWANVLGVTQTRLREITEG